jgi:hypothetical protein
VSPRTVFVHVGCRKTGTSFLQKSVYSSADELAAQGIALPLPNRGAHYRVVAALREVAAGQPLPRESSTVFDDLARRIAETTADRAIITHEALAPATPAQVRALTDTLDGCEVHLVITARDLARQIPSEWQQTVKDRSVLTYAAFCREVVAGGTDAAHQFWARQDVVDIARRWSADLPPERVHVVAVPPAGSPPELLLGMFCGLIGCDPASLVALGGYNPSLGAEQAELLRRVNVALGDRLTDLRVKGGYRDVVRGSLAKAVLAHQQGTPLGLPDDLREWCREQSEARVAELGTRGYDVVGQLDDLVPAASTEPDGGQSATEVTDAQVAHAAAEALASLAHHQHRLLDEERQERRRSRKAAQTQRFARPDPSPAASLPNGLRQRAGRLVPRVRNR